MRIKTLLTALLLTVTPVLAVACPAHDDRQAMSCAEGHTWDTEQGTCVPIVTG